MKYLLMMKLNALICSSVVLLFGTSIFAEQGDFFSWRPTTQKVIYQPSSAGGAFSPKIVKLANGDWLCVYDTTSNMTSGPTVVCVSKSVDQGNTWTYLSQVSSESLSAATGQLLVLPNGTVLCAYRIGLPSDVTKTIKVAKSTNGGTSWQYLSTVVSNTAGVWEPCMLLKGNGEILLFYANDDSSTGYDQCIDVRKSTDSGVTWSARQFVCGYTGSRDGVPVAALLNNGDILTVVESVNNDQFGGRSVIMSVRSTNGGTTWGTRQLLYDPLSPSSAFAPCIVQMASGELVVSCQTSVPNMAANMAVLVSTNNGSSWVMQDWPFTTPTNSFGSVFNSLFVQDSKTIVATTSTWPLGYYELEMIKGSTDHLIGNWKLDGNANDSSSNNNGGTVIGSVAWVSGINGQAADFDGSSGPAYIRIDNSDGYKINKFTVSCWVNVQQWGPDIFNQYVALHNNDAGWGLSRELDTSHSCMLLRGPTTGAVSGTKTVDNNQWHHVAATWKGSTGELKLYFDGWLENSSTNSGAINYSWSGTVPLVIGGRIYSDPIEAPLWLAGHVQVDDVRIYDYALNQSEIGQLFNAFTGLPYCPQYPVGDINKDCRVTFADFAVIAQNWTACNLVPDCF